MSLRRVVHPPTTVEDEFTYAVGVVWAGYVHESSLKASYVIIHARPRSSSRAIAIASTDVVAALPNERDRDDDENDGDDDECDDECDACGTSRTKHVNEFVTSCARVDVHGDTRANGRERANERTNARWTRMMDCARDTI